MYIWMVQTEAGGRFKVRGWLLYVHLTELRGLGILQMDDR